MPEDAKRKYSCQITSALLNHQTKSTNWAGLNLMNSVTSESSLDYQQNIDNESFNVQLIKQLLKSIDQNNPNSQILLSRQVYLLPRRDQTKQSNKNENRIKLYCTSNSFPNGPVKWFKQTNQQINQLEPIAAQLDDQIDHFNLEFDSTVLTINSPKLKDSGLYIAILNNRLQTNIDLNVKCAIQLTIREPLKVEVNLLKPNLNLIKNKDTLIDSDLNVHSNINSISSNSDSYSLQNSINSINCTVYGYPVNQIQFYHNGLLLDTVLLSSNNNNFKSLSDEPQVKTYSLNLNPNYSVIENGVYQCFAISDYEIEVGSYTLMQTRKFL